MLVLVVAMLSACDMILQLPTDLTGTWVIESLKANGEEYIDNEHVLAYAPNIANSTIVFGADNTFELTFVYADNSNAEIHRGTYTLNGTVVEFNATKCENLAKEKTCQFRGEVEGNKLYISKSFSAGSLWIIPIETESAAVMVSFKLQN